MHIFCIKKGPDLKMKFSFVLEITWFAKKIVKMILSVKRKKFATKENANLVA